MKRCKQAQISMEYLIIMGFVFLMLTPILYIYAEQSQSLSNQVEINQLYKISRKLADKSEEIYYLGYPSKATIKFYMPDKVTNFSIQQNTMIFTILKDTGGTSQIMYLSPVNISGEIKIFQGVHYIEIKAEEGYVRINETSY